VHSGTVQAGTGGYRRRMYMYILELFMLERGGMKFGIGRMVECELYNQWNGHEWNACDVALQVRRSPSEKSAADSSVHPSAPPGTRSHPPRGPRPAPQFSFSFSRVTRLKLRITISPCLWLLIYRPCLHVAIVLSPPYGFFVIG
jgi:hypothetical protein